MNTIVCIRRLVIGYAGITLLAGTASAAGEEDIRDIRGPKTLLAGSWVVPAVIAGVIIVVALCAYIVRRRRQRGTRARSLTLAEQALARLEETRPLMRPDSAREFELLWILSHPLR